MISRLLNRGFKDQERGAELCGLDLFTSGDVNGVGKSAVLEGFKLGLLGEIPGRARSVEDILQFTTRDEMSIELTVQSANEQFVFERRFAGSGPRGEKRPIFINGMQKKFEEGHRWIEERVGAVSVGFDPQEFLNLTPKRKRQWIIAHSPETWNLKKEILYIVVLAGLAERLLGDGLVQSLLAEYGMSHPLDLANSSAPAEKFFRGLCESLNKQDKNVWEDVRPVMDWAFLVWDDSMTADRNIEFMLSRLQAESLRLKSVVRELDAAGSFLREIFEGPVKLDIQKRLDKFDRLDDRLQKRRRFLQRKIDSLSGKLRESSTCDLIRGILKSCRGEAQWINSLLPKDEKQSAEDKNRLSFEICELAQRAAIDHLLAKKTDALRQADWIKKLTETLTAMQTHIANGVAEGLQNEVNDLLAKTNSGFQFQIDLDEKHFDMAWNRSGKVIPVATINSAHFVLLIGPFLTAVVNRFARVREKSNLPTLRALCIEAESLTPANLVVLLKGLAWFRNNGYLDNVLVAHYSSITDPEKLCGFKEHVLVPGEAKGSVKCKN